MVRFEKPVRCMTEVMDVPLTMKLRTGIFESKSIAHNLTPRLRDWGSLLLGLVYRIIYLLKKRSIVFNYVYNQNPCEALKSVEFNLS